MLSNERHKNLRYLLNTNTYIIVDKIPEDIQRIYGTDSHSLKVMATPLAIKTFKYDDYFSSETFPYICYLTSI